MSKTKIKVYTKEHSSKKALDAHARKIKKRGGEVEKKGKKLIYNFKSNID